MLQKAAMRLDSEGDAEAGSHIAGMATDPERIILSLSKDYDGIVVLQENPDGHSYGEAKFIPFAEEQAN